MEILAFIKNFFNGLTLEPSRKRRATDDFETVSAKSRKLNNSSHMAGQEDDWLSSSSSEGIRRRSQYFTPTPGAKTRSSISNLTTPVINLDDDEAIIQRARDSIKKGSRFTSTPNYSANRSTIKDDDVTFLKYIEPSPENRASLKKRADPPIKLPSSFFSDPLSNGTSRAAQNGSKPKLVSSFRPKFATPVRKPFGSYLDQSFRLDDKRRYQELLKINKVGQRDQESYGTPTGKLFSNGRGKKMELSQRDRPVDLIDLTRSDSVKPGSAKSPSARESTTDTIKKVLNEFDNDLIIVKDSDSDVEILPTPPSPTPDFKIKPVNSLKKFVDSSEPLHNDWISNLFNQHRDAWAKREKEIEEQKLRKLKLSDINKEIHVKRLEDGIRKVLTIKEALLPIEVKDEPALPPLTKAQEELVHRAFDQRASPNEVLAKKFNLNITRRDLLTLKGLNWLNDEVINFYMNLIIERGKDKKWPAAYAMNTFFYMKLSNDGYVSVRRWTRKVDIFSYDIIAVPIHLGMHWCMAIIDLRAKTVNYYDSMGGVNRSCINSLMSYLQEEHLDKKKCEMDTKGWSMKCVKDIPQQMNGSDCGMFSCTFAEFLTRDSSITFDQGDMPYLRRKMVVEIIEGRLLIS